MVSTRLKSGLKRFQQISKRLRDGEIQNAAGRTLPSGEKEGGRGAVGAAAAYLEAEWNMRVGGEGDEDV